jgi:hypothetical protein
MNGPREISATDSSAEFKVDDPENKSDDPSHEALPYQAGDWAKKFKELCQYRQSTGKCTFQSYYFILYIFIVNSITVKFLPSDAVE